MKKSHKNKSALIKVVFLMAIVLALVITVAACNTTYTVTFDTDGGGTIQPQTVRQGSKVTRPEETPSKTGYTFLDWYKEGKSIVFDFDSVLTTSDTTIYAKYRANMYYVRYDKNAATAINPMSDSTHTYDTPGALSECTSTRANYTFAGWNTKADGTGTSYDDKQSVTNLASEDGAIITLYAVWAANSYDILYKDIGGGTFSGTHGTNAPVKHTYGKATNLVNPTKDDFDFGGWYLTENGSGSPVTTLSATGYTADIPLYARWNDRIKGRYTATTGSYYIFLVLNGNGTGTLTFKNGTTTVLNSANITYVLTEDTFSINEISDVSATAGFESGALTNFKLHTDTLDIDFTLVNIYNIIYKDAGGAAFSGNHGNNYPTEYASNAATTLVTPNKNLCEFKGWYLDENCGGAPVTSLAAGEYEADITVYAKWEVFAGKFVAATTGVTITLVVNGTGTGTFAVASMLINVPATPMTYTLINNVFTLNSVSVSGYNISGQGNVADGTIKSFTLTSSPALPVSLGTLNFVRQA